MSANAVHVKNISSQTSEKEIKDFFSFCGKITNLEISSAGETQNATVTFEKETAAKTALLLDNTQLGATQVQVTSAGGSKEDDSSHYNSQHERDSDEITQEEKPRSRIVAEYLAHGYSLGDHVLQQAIDLDQKHGVSNRFLNTLQALDTKYHATDKAKSVDESYGVIPKVNSFLSGLTSYYEKAAGTPSGKKLVDFYTQTSRQVVDIHNEARRLADLKKEQTTCKCDSVSENCRCELGHCAHASCDKLEVKKAPGSNKTTCNCGGSTENCPCAPGECACASCPKAQTEKVAADSDMVTCKCGGDIKSCTCVPGNCVCGSCSKAETQHIANTHTATCNCGH